MALASFTDFNDFGDMIFDSDSFVIATDNCTSYCMTNNKSDFIGKTRKINRNILGIGVTNALMMGLVQWTIQADNGHSETFDILDVLYVPDLPVRLLSPQHWAQAYASMGAHSDTDAHRITLEWDNHVKTIPLNALNVGVFHLAPGYHSSRPVLRALAAMDPHQFCVEAHVILPDDDDISPSVPEPTRVGARGSSDDNRPMPSLTPGNDDNDFETEGCDVPNMVDFEFGRCHFWKNKTSKSKTSHTTGTHWHNYSIGTTALGICHSRPFKPWLTKANYRHPLPGARFHTSAQLASVVKQPREPGTLELLLTE